MRGLERSQQRERGFTMVELLVVIVILGILAGVVIFAVGNSTENASLVSCPRRGQRVSARCRRRGSRETARRDRRQQAADGCRRVKAAGLLDRISLRYLTTAVGGQALSGHVRENGLGPTQLAAHPTRTAPEVTVDQLPAGAPAGTGIGGLISLACIERTTASW